MPPTKPNPKRCAVYTRKSSEEGLEQDFNSLHAQRESCEAFIRSQKAEGWRLVEAAYDDGGFSGGTMDRPALQRLLADIKARRIDVVVVYKIDRLTRALADFAKMVEVFDAHSVSFVAVTQQFNTTTSMGRLTLNILLSFAQFEREVTAERIRDKIAASKRKGMWMGGVVPLGYDVEDRRLVVNTAEAATVRTIFRRYLDLGCVRRLAENLERDGIRSKRHTGKRCGGTVLGRGALYTLLANPLYVGEVRYCKATYPGLHEAIIEREQWDEVQRMLAGNGVTRAMRPTRVAPSPLAGKLYDGNGERLTPSHTVKAARRYRYYVSHPLITGTVDQAPERWRLPAQEVENAVGEALSGILADRAGLATAMRAAGLALEKLSAVFAAAAAWRKRVEAGTEAPAAVAAIVERVEVRDDGLLLTVSLAALLQPEAIVTDVEALTITRAIPMQLKRRGCEMRLVVDGAGPLPKVDPALIKALARARAWFDELASGAMPSLAAIARREGITDRYIGQLLPLAFLAPDLVAAIVAGTQPVGLTAETLIRHIDLPADWGEQRRALGFG